MAERIELLASPPPVETSRSGIHTDKHPEHRLEEIALSAYYRAEARGFAPGCEVGDWLEAERENVAKVGMNDGSAE